MSSTSSLKTLLLVGVAFFLSPLHANAQDAKEVLTPGTVSMAAEDMLDPSQPAHAAKAIEEGDGGDASVAPVPATEHKTGKDGKLTGQYLQPVASETAIQETPKDHALAGVNNQALLDALRTAYLNNPTLRAARAEMRSTSEFLPQAQSGWMPQSDVTGTITTADIDPETTGDGTTSQNLAWSLTQSLYRGGRTVAGTSSAENRILAQGAILNATEQQLLLDVATAYMDVVRDRAFVDLNDSNIQVVNRQLDATRARFELGEVTRTDVAQAEARLARAQADYKASTGNLKSSLARYEKLVGSPPENIQKATVNFAFPDTLDQATAQADKNNPVVIASEFLHQSAEKDIGVVFGELLPELGLSASVDKTWDPQPGGLDDETVKSLSLIATMPLYEGGFTRSRVRQAKYQANQRYIEILETKRSARENVISDWETLVAARGEIVSRKSQVEANRVAQEGVHMESDLGTRTILDALDADQEYLDSQTALVSAERDEIVANFALARSLGILTPQALGFADIAYNPMIDRDRADWKMLGMDVDRVE